MSNNNATCYKPDGTEASDDPCGLPNLSTCCGRGWDCLSNGLCRQHGTTGYSQSTCTNPSYENCLSFCNSGQFDGFTEVNRCESNGNSWCCAGAAGQGLSGPDCCDTNGTTSLEPYPFSAIDDSGQSAVADSSISPSITSTNLISMRTLPLTGSLISSSIISTEPLSSRTAIISATSPSFGLGTSLQSSRRTLAATTTQILSTPSQIPSISSSPQPTDQVHSLKIGIEVGIPAAIVVILLAILMFFMFQNRKFQQRLLQLREQMGEGSLGQGHGKPEVQECEGDTVGELGITYYELSHRNAPRHELLGNEIHELNHSGIPKHELVGDGPRR